MDFDIRKFDPGSLAPDNGLQATRLMPWRELNAPFEGSWCVVPPGASSGAHGHHEYEIWIAMDGTADVLCEGRRIPFAAGDVVHFPPGSVHQVINDGAGEFRMYAVWWDTDMAAAFAERDRVDA